jgi:hypothetical protein
MESKVVTFSASVYDAGNILQNMAALCQVRLF